MVDRLTKPVNMELNYDARKLKYETREQVGKNYLKWRWITATGEAQLHSMKLLSWGVFAAGVLINPLFLLLLVLLIPKILGAQFYWGDMLDEQEKYLGKYVLRVDGVKGGKLID
ncbi:MAG: hypothetical protein ABIA76_01270 [Candidatus Diapherotrites archaeon]